MRFVGHVALSVVMLASSGCGKDGGSSGDSTKVAAIKSFSSGIFDQITAAQARGQQFQAQLTALQSLTTTQFSEKYLATLDDGNLQFAGQSFSGLKTALRQAVDRNTMRHGSIAQLLKAASVDSQSVTFTELQAAVEHMVYILKGMPAANLGLKERAAILKVNTLLAASTENAVASVQGLGLVASGWSKAGPSGTASLAATAAVQDGLPVIKVDTAPHSAFFLSKCREVFAKLKAWHITLPQPTAAIDRFEAETGRSMSDCPSYLWYQDERGAASDTSSSGMPTPANSNDSPDPGIQWFYNNNPGGYSTSSSDMSTSKDSVMSGGNTRRPVSSDTANSSEIKKPASI